MPGYLNEASKDCLGETWFDNGRANDPRGEGDERQLRLSNIRRRRRKERQQLKQLLRRRHGLIYV